ncbi:THAP domain-containing protein 3-like [Diorhabda sublineata]|uniref:THAP domain-containing protein 3-like n=1 Tax=Diorhabda sublineata TaxID=1163346 RepID=UPI0024E0D524|nr:THAP domain-containing protein 3-like [Diorhabda sublineata]
MKLCLFDFSACSICPKIKMPGTRCAVYGCGNTYKTRQQEHEYFIFHRFPKAKDLVSQTMRKEWILRCKREDKFNPDTSYICSVHFTEKDYERDLQNELLGLPLRKILKKTAVPTLGLYSKKSTSEASSSSISSREERLAKRNAKEEVNKLLKVATLTAPINTFSDDTEDHNPKSFGSIQFEEHVPEPSTSSTPNFVPENYDYKALYNESVEKYEKLERQYALLKSRSNIKSTNIKKLNEQLKYFKNKCYKSSPKSPKS